jgi:hypothetical protein
MKKQHLYAAARALAAWGAALAVVLASLTVSVMTASAHEGMEHIIGTVVSVSDNTLSVKTTKGTTVEVRLDAKTEYALGKERAKLGDVKPGSRVVVHAMKMNGAFVAHEVSIGANKPAAPPTKKEQK